MKSQRPVNLDLRTIKLPITGVTSFLHRVSGIILFLGLAIMLYALLVRADGDINVLRDRNPLFVPLSDGGIRNSYTVKLINKKHERRVFRLSVEGLEGANVAIVGAFGVPNVEVDPARVEAHRMVVVAPGKSVRESTDIVIVATDIFTGQRFENGTTFKGPRRR